MSHEFKVGDRVRVEKTTALIEEVRGATGVITKFEGSLAYALLDDRRNPTSHGWSFQKQYLTLEEPEVTDEEIKALFNVKIEPCTHCGCVSGGVH